ncbi:hypothetical protein JCM5353_005937 [Sporobolomyces roseus]
MAEITEKEPTKLESGSLGGASSTEGEGGMRRRHDGPGEKNIFNYEGVDGHSNGQVKRTLKARHLQMIALGGTIGTGLFVGAGSALASAGTVGCWLGYVIMSGIVWTMMTALGEMTTMFPVSGAFVHYASRFCDPALGFALGWNYWASWAMTFPLEVVAAALVLDYWPGAAEVHVAVWLTVFLIVIASFNFLGARAFGEAEFWFSLIKIVALLGLMILSIIITAGGVPGSDPNEYPIGFRYWNSVPFQQQNGIGGAKGQFLAFLTVFVQASYSFLGTEIVALAAGEAQNPRRNVPKAIKRVFWRIAFFYVIGIMCMTLIVSPNDERLLGNSDASASPWVIGIQRAGISALPSIINAVILIAAFSAGNSDLYAASRTLYGLARDGQAPRILARCTKGGLPIYALLVTCLVGFLAYMNVGTTAERAFNDLVTITSITGIINWAVINFTFLRFYYGCKRQGIDRNTFAYKSPMQPYSAFIGLILLILVILFNSYYVFLDGSWDPEVFVCAYIGIPFFFIVYFVYKFWTKSKWVSLDAMDFESGRRVLDEMEDEQALMHERETKTVLQKVWDWMM